MNLAAALYSRLASDPNLTALLAVYDGEPAVFTTDPAPGAASLPYIVSAGEVVNRPYDTKTTRGRECWRDVWCYSAATGSVAVVEEIAERVRSLLHRFPLEVAAHETWIAEVTGPIAADEEDAYGRILTLRLVVQED